MIETRLEPVSPPGWSTTVAYADDVWPEMGPLPPDPMSPEEWQAALEASVELDRSVVAWWRAELVEAVLPAQEAALIDLIRELEDLKSTAAAVQARAAVAFEVARHQAEADRGVPKSLRGKGVGAEVAYARRESPHRGGRLQGLAGPSSRSSLAPWSRWPRVC